MLSEQEIKQICREYDIVCPICGTPNSFYRLKRDICRASETEGDGHPLKWRWAKPGFDSVDPKLFFFGTCQSCRFTAEMDDADFRTSNKKPDLYKAKFLEPELRQLVVRSSTGKGIAQVLGKRAKEGDPLGALIAQFHLAIFIQCLLVSIVPGNIARYYLRMAWLYRDREKYFADADPATIAQIFERFRERWAKDLPVHDDFTDPPGIASNEAEALFFARAYFERNYETLREANQEEELRLQYLLAEIGFRLYELTDEKGDYKKASSYFSGTMQRSLSIMNDKGIVGGMVNRAREMLENCGERGRELRALRKSRGGDTKEETTPEEQESKGKKTVKKGVKKTEKEEKKGVDLLLKKEKTTVEVGPESPGESCSQTWIRSPARLVCCRKNSRR